MLWIKYHNMRTVHSEHFWMAAFNQSQFVIPDSNPRWRQSDVVWWSLPSQWTRRCFCCRKLHRMFKISFAMEWFLKWIILGCLEVPKYKRLLNHIYRWQLFSSLFAITCISSWMVMEMAEVSRRVNFGSKLGHVRKSLDNVQIRW